jgi:RHS repeat-associated protein
LKKDRNKKIAAISYNYLKLPEIITFENNRIITNEYDANGTKLKKIDSNGEVTDYEEDEIYDNAVLYQIGYGEGRIVNGIYEYNITDHLGNLRIVFKDSLGNPKILQSNAYGPWGEDLKTLKYANTTRPNTFTFNEKEVEDDFNLGLIDYKNRFHDAILGRFISIDPLAEEYSYNSTFAFAENKLGLGMEYEGLEMIGFPIFGELPPIIEPTFVRPMSPVARVMPEPIGRVAPIEPIGRTVETMSKPKIEPISERVVKTESGKQESVTKTNPKDGYAPKSELARNKDGTPKPDAEGNGQPHTQLGTKKGSKGDYRQGREFDDKGKPVKDVDFTDHGRPQNHTNPHQHPYQPNKTGGTPQRGPQEPLNTGLEVFYIILKQII